MPPEIFGNSFLNDETPIRTEAATAPAAAGGVTPMMEQ
jgi:hypothetical protein